jgi:guanine deaminase
MTPAETGGQEAALPAKPPFAVRARAVTPLTSGGFLDEHDALIVIDPGGSIGWIGAAAAAPPAPSDIIDVRPWVALPGLVDLHAHLPQLPISGLGFGMRVMTWLDELMIPVERAFDGGASRRLSPAYFREFAAAGTTTVCLYSSVGADATDAAFEAAEQHGMRVVLGQPLMDLWRYDTEIPDSQVIDVRLRQAAELCRKWHGRDRGRIMYAFTPRGAMGCSARLIEESARLADQTGAYWQTHLSEDVAEAAAGVQAHPTAQDPLDIYDRAGGLGPRSILAHAVYVSDRELARIAETQSVIAHCPSNVWLGGGVMRLARYRELGLTVGLGSDAGGSMGLSMWIAMQLGAISQNSRAILLGDAEADRRGRLAPAQWLELASLAGARALGLGDRIGSLETGKEADFILVDPALTAPVAGGGGPGIDATEPLLSRLIFRQHPAMVRGSWVRGRRLSGPAGWSGAAGPVTRSA